MRELVLLLVLVLHLLLVLVVDELLVGGVHRVVVIGASLVVVDGLVVNEAVSTLPSRTGNKGVWGETRAREQWQRLKSTWRLGSGMLHSSSSESSKVSVGAGILACADDVFGGAW